MEKKLIFSLKEEFQIMHSNEEFTKEPNGIWLWYSIGSHSNRLLYVGDEFESLSFENVMDFLKPSSICPVLFTFCNEEIIQEIEEVLKEDKRYYLHLGEDTLAIDISAKDIIHRQLF